MYHLTHRCSLVQIHKISALLARRAVLAEDIAGRFLEEGISKEIIYSGGWLPWNCQKPASY